MDHPSQPKPERRRLLLFTNKLGYQTRSFEEAARKHDAEIIYVTDRCHQLEDPWGDRAIAVHFDSPPSAAANVVEALKGESVDGILALGDSPSVAAAYTARELGISYNHPAAVEACRSKLRMREVFRETGLKTPRFRAINLDPLPEPMLLGISYPCVLKPISLSASRGVIRANNRDEFIAAAQRIRKLLESPEIRATREAHLDQILVEGYIPGREVAVEGLLTDGVLKILAIFDKPDPLEGPYFEETIYVTPSSLSQLQQAAIQKCVQDCARAIGLTRGPAHAEFRISGEGLADDQVWPLEIAARPIGGLCARALRFVENENQTTEDKNGREQAHIGLEELLLLHSLDLPVSDWVRERMA
jgi:biotin carboxylase